VYERERGEGEERKVWALVGRTPRKMPWQKHNFLVVEIERLVLRIYLKVDIYKSINKFDAYMQLYRFVYITSDLCLSMTRIHPKGAIICVCSEDSDCLLYFFTQFHTVDNLDH
jgi:hypothetical protein